MTTEDEILSRAYDVGNYAYVYVNEELEEAYELREEGTHLHEAHTRVFRAGYVIGFFSSFEEHEIPVEHVEEWRAALRDYAIPLHRLGVAVFEGNRP